MAIFRKMASPFTEAQKLKEDADRLLTDTGLGPILTRHGEVLFTGSYHYDLLTWRDIDICLSITEPPMQVASAIVARLCQTDVVASIYIRNEHVLKTEGNPEAVFVCVEFLPAHREHWKVDVLLGSPALVARTVAPGRELVARLNPATRDAILRIKSVLCKHPQYRREIKSTDIYHAVIDEGVRDIAGWEVWWADKQKEAQAPY